MSILDVLYGTDFCSNRSKGGDDRPPNKHMWVGSKVYCLFRRIQQIIEPIMATRVSGMAGGMCGGRVGRPTQVSHEGLIGGMLGKGIYKARVLCQPCRATRMWSFGDQAVTCVKSGSIVLLQRQGTAAGAWQNRKAIS